MDDTHVESFAEAASDGIAFDGIEPAVECGRTCRDRQRKQSRRCRGSHGLADAYTIIYRGV